MEGLAMQRISDFIKDDSNLENLAQIKEQIKKEKSTVEYQLTKLSKSRYGEIQKCLETISNSTVVVDALREKLRSIDRLSKENKYSIKSYEVFNKVTRIHELISRTTDIYNKIVNFGDFCNMIDVFLNENFSQDLLETGCPRLLEIHFMLNRARDFCDQMTIFANVSTEDVQRTVKRVFAKLPGQIEKFDDLMTSIIYDLLEGARKENCSLLIRFFKVIDFEIREDQKIIQTRLIIKNKELEMESNRVKKLPSKLARLDENLEPKIIEYPTDQALFEEIMNGTIQTRTNARGYKQFLFNAIDQAIKDLFEDVRKEYSGSRRFEVLDNLDWVFNDLVIAKDHLSKFSPADLDMFSKYYDSYYKELNRLVLELINSEPESAVILHILDFDKMFMSTLKKDFGFSKEQAVSIIGEKEKEKLLQDYLNLIVSKMGEWLRNLEATELSLFEQRTSPPHTDSENLLFLDGTKTCFQMFTQQVEVAAGSGQAKILVGVVERFCELMSQRQSNWMRTIGKEVKKCIQYNRKYEENPESIKKEDESAGGLVEYLVAVANDQMKAADYAVAISQKYGSMVSKVHERTIINHIEQTLDGFAEVAKCSTNGLVILIFDDLRKPYSELFSKSWYTGNQAQQISDTLFEYLSDIRSQMNPFVYSTLVESIIEETILKFIHALKFDHVFKTKQNKFLECMKRDFEIFYKLFIQFVPNEEKHIIDEKFKLMEFFMDFSCSPVDIIIETWVQCLDVYWDTPLEFLQSILKCRKGLDSTSIKQLTAQAQAIANDPARLDAIKSQDLQPTFISRFK
ncbi:HCL174Cp [Eremothecium sinecaudum]|uniref:HCL174Cp n=1 Tax=Eremothecium sinecaudum TaxID=45286 RepID=A0A0X8HR96_9SACH|nr:HCL174Cp [Eremothecium sinecaudum]AMD19977.1 HCL174Cp [Eremothecium sinecaudum]